MEFPIYEVEPAPQNPKIHKKQYTLQNSRNPAQNIRYQILTYEKNLVAFDDENTAKYRSVVFSESGRLLSFSPPKSTILNYFMLKHPEVPNEAVHAHAPSIPSHVHITEAIEGTMISLFYDHELETWEIATKNAVGGRYWYFQTEQSSAAAIAAPAKTFREMFMEAIGEPIYGDLNQTLLVKTLDRHYCYNFVLQHPANHLVFQIKNPRVYLVAMYHIDGPRNTATYYSLPYFRKLSMIQELVEEGIVSLPPDAICPPNPPLYKLLDQYLNYCEGFAHMMGMMLIDTKTGERTKVESKQYQYKQKLRGNHPSLQYQYLCLARIKKTDEFLEYFPIYRELFKIYREQFQDFATGIHQTYYTWYVLKQRESIFSKHIMYFVNRIHHEIYIPSFATTPRKIITKNVVVDWLLDTFEPGVLLCHLALSNDRADQDVK